jgi:quinol monooxygenase YgiN
MSLYNVISDLEELRIKRLNKNQEKLQVEDELFEIDQDMLLIKQHIFNHMCKKDAEYTCNPKSDEILAIGKWSAFIYEGSHTDSDGNLCYEVLIKHTKNGRFRAGVIPTSIMYEMFMNTNEYAAHYREAVINHIVEDDK